SLALVLAYFNLIEKSPKAYLKLAFLDKKWIANWYGTLFTIFFYGILSMFVAYFYYLVLRRINGLVIGIVFGIGMWLIVLLLFPLFFSELPYILSLPKRSLVTSWCLFILYGVFIGYSISFDYRQAILQGNRS